MKTNFTMLILSLTLLICSNLSIANPTHEHQTQQVSKRSLGALYSKLIQIEDDLHQLQFYMGKPGQANRIITIANGSPRTLYFAAQAMFNKANQLSFEVTNSIQQIHSADTVSKANFTDTTSLVTHTLQRIAAIKRYLKIESHSVRIPNETNITSSTLINTILINNQTLNRLLYNTFKPSDVYTQVTIALSYTNNILKTLKAPEQMKEPSYQPGQVPKNVYKQLLQCAMLLNKIGKLNGIPMITIYFNTRAESSITPGDVFDLSKIIVSEVSQLNHLIGSKENNVSVVQPRYKTPSDVYQKATQLYENLSLILKRVSVNAKR